VDKELAEKLYDDEHERKAELLNQVTLVLGILTVSVGFFGYYVSNVLSSIPWDNQTTALSRWNFQCLIVLLGVDLVTLSVAGFFLTRALHNHTYYYLPSPRTLASYYDSLLRHYHKTSPNDATRHARDCFEMHVIQQRVDAAEHNQQVNFRRKMSVFVATRWCVVSLVLLVVTFLPFVLTERTDASKTRITGFGEALTVRLQAESKSKGSPTTKTNEEARYGEVQRVRPAEPKPRAAKTNASDTPTTPTTPTATDDQGKRGQVLQPPQEGLTNSSTGRVGRTPSVPPTLPAGSAPPVSP